MNDATDTTVRVEVASPEFPCGSAWLANCLLELGVPLWHLWGFDTHEEWIPIDGSVHRYAAEHQPWRQTLASLVPGREFTFRKGIAVRFSHEWPWNMGPAARVVLMVRDPRDALYSEWQRHRHNLHLPDHVPFGEFLRSPFFGGPVSVVDTLWLSLRCWIGFRDALPSRIKLLRFEDWKRDPVTALRDVVEWMGVPADARSIRGAVDASDVRNLQRIEEALITNDPAARRFNRRGQPEEWRIAWQSDWFDALGGHWQPVLASLAYEPLVRPGVANPPSNVDAALAWRGLTDPVQRAFWRNRVMTDFNAHRCSSDG